MKLRNQVLIILLLFGFTPLVVALAINLPLVMGGLELFYHKAYLQNLRADFRDLDQHLASRIEMIRLLAKLPEPGIILSPSDEEGRAELETARTRYIEWINRLMLDQPDIIEILFLDIDRGGQFRLERNRESLELIPKLDSEDIPLTPEIQTAMRFNQGGVLTSPISISPEGRESGLTRDMTLRLISPIYPPFNPTEHEGSAPPVLGTVIIIIDIGGLARVYDNTYWVLNDGSYLTLSKLKQSSASAFEDFSGLEKIFSENKLALWEGRQGNQIIWVPLFATDRSGPLWVGRQVDPSPIAYVKQELFTRAALIIAPLILAILLFARWFAVRAERFGQDLLEGLKRMLNRSENVTFSWSGPQELHVLGEQLSQLSKTHAENSAALHAHAKQLEESNRYKSEFLANVSHELRTPLNSILLLSKLLAEGGKGALPATSVHQARIIHDAGRDLMALIDNILDLSRIEAGKSTFRLEKIYLERLLMGLEELFQPQFEAKALSFQLEIADGTPDIIWTDGDKLSQIIKNFLSNAVKFTENGGVTLRLENNVSNTGNDYPVRISVQDTGIGIPRHKQAEIFEAFEQADGSTSRRYGGTGLGLSISRELAHLIGGMIELDSTEGQGSTFSLIMPLEFQRHGVDDDQILSEPLTVQDEPKDATHKIDIALPEADFQNKNILIVDDDLKNLLALTPLLERWGLNITAAGDGQEALDTLGGADRFDLVLMDIMLPGMDGFETIRKIRQQPQFRDMPIICLSAKGGSDNRNQCIEAGANDILPKPVEPTLLMTMLSDNLTTTEISATSN
jgi:signal transduction histidine kinase/ActR/RegA family two-component response regulator